MERTFRVNRLGLVAGVVALCVVPSLGARMDREHQLKAAFIFNFTKFCEWTFPASDSPIKIGVFETDVYGGSLDTLNGKAVAGHSVTVQRIGSEDDIPHYQMAVLGDIGTDRLRRIVRLCKGSGTLLVGESESFARSGGTIGFVIRDGTVRFDVNRTTATLDNVQLSSKLLRLAGQVY
jgi:hypothetical protein